MTDETIRKIRFIDENDHNLMPRTLAELVKNANGDTLEGVEANAQVNKIETLKVNGTIQTPVNKTINITVPTPPVYSIIKETTAESGQVATYRLTMDGTKVGTSINIPKDMVLQSGSLKTCTTANQPVTGYAVGDKYIDLVLANADNSHIYIFVKDLVDVYTSGEGITITNSVISVNKTSLAQTFATKTELNTKANSTDIPSKTSQLTNDSGFLTAHQSIASKADKATTLSGYGITDAYTKTEVDAKIKTASSKIKYVEITE